MFGKIESILLYALIS